MRKFSSLVDDVLEKELDLLRRRFEDRSITDICYERQCETRRGYCWLLVFKAVCED